MPIPKSKQNLFGKVIGANLNRGVPREIAKKRAEAAVEEALLKKPKKKKRKKKKGGKTA